MPDNESNQTSLEKLLIMQSDFSNQIGLAVESNASDSPKVDLLYLKFKEDRPAENEFVEVIFHQLMNYALPAKKRQEIYGQSGNILDTSKHVKLFAEARRSFIAYNASHPSSQSENRYSEVGELISFCVASQYLGAAQIAAKMALKTSSEMPVFGLDGIHARFEPDSSLTVFYIESKMTSKADSGASQYAESAAKFEEDRKHKLNEYRIVRDLSNLDSLEGVEREIAINYFDPYGSKSEKVRERFVGIIVYSEPLYGKKLDVSDEQPIDIHENHFRVNYIQKRDVMTEYIRKYLVKSGATLGKSRAFYVAVPCTKTLKKLFAGEVSGEHVR